MRRAPRFWWSPAPDARALLLAPLGSLYGAVTARRMARPGARVGVPIVCIGNFVVGGAGKTPTAIALARALQAAGETPFFLTRGYGAPAPLCAPARVDLARHGYAQTGDEPRLLAAVAPTIVAHDRAAGARLAVEQGASVIVMDDGMQNPLLHKDFTIAVVDGATGVGNGLCVPAGPLRAPLAAQTPFVDAAILIGESPQAAMREIFPAAVAARLVPAPDAAAALAGRRTLAFAGIGRPDKFFETVLESGATLVGTRAFPDHHPFTASDLEELRARARALEATLVTTEKDLVRLPDAGDVLSLPVTLATNPPSAIAALAAAALRKARGPAAG